jgi:hypothetical protein
MWDEEDGRERGRGGTSISREIFVASLVKSSHLLFLVQINWRYTASPTLLEVTHTPTSRPHTQHQSIRSSRLMGQSVTISWSHRY